LLGIVELSKYKQNVVYVNFYMRQILFDDFQQNINSITFYALLKAKKNTLFLEKTKDKDKDKDGG